MDNWLLIIVATIFIICIVVGYVRGFLKLGISLFSTVLTLILVLFLSPYVANALEEYTPVDDYIESRIVEAFIPDITEEQLSQIDLSGTPFADLTNDQLANLNDLDWDLLGITTDDILNLIGEIPKDMQIQEIENAPMPQFLKDELIENNNSTIYGELGVNSFPRYVAAYISRLVLNLLSFLVTFLLAIIGDFQLHQLLAAVVAGDGDGFRRFTGCSLAAGADCAAGRSGCLSGAGHQAEGHCTSKGKGNDLFLHHVSPFLKSTEN